MKRNCGLELGVSSPPQYHSMSDMKRREEKKQTLTIFCDGKVAICDVTELQARAIILIASRDMAGKLNKKPGWETWKRKPGSNPSLLPFLQSPLNRLSMKKSLQRFLQKRKTRIQAASPYHHV